MLTSRAPVERIELPHEPGEWVDVRMLSSEQIKRARMAAQREGIAYMRDLGGELVRELQSIAPGGERAAEAEEIRAEIAVETATNPLAGLDRLTLLEEGIVKWSYYDTKPLAKDIADLDEETAQYIAERIAPRPRTAADQKNGSAPSTTPWTE